MELLAHASAPSSRKDDERFRRQAQAYSSFQSGNVVSIHSNNDVESTEKPMMVAISPAPANHFNSSTYLDNTQDAWTALNSQLYAVSQESPQDNEDESGNVDPVDGTILQLPVDSSQQPHRPTGILPPNESALISDSSTELVLTRFSSSRATTGPHAQDPRIPTSSRPLHISEDTSPSYVDGLSAVNVAETPLRRVTMLRTLNMPLPQDNFSSPSDDIPSQLPSTYSISDINSDPAHGDPHEPPSSSVWGSLPRGSAPQPWNGVIEDESPLKGLRSMGKHRVQRSSPLKQTQSLESPRANMSAHIRPAHSSLESGQDEVSSVSLDRAVTRQAGQQTEHACQVFTSSLESRFSSAPQAQGTQVSNPNTDIHSSPAQGVHSTVLSDMRARTRQQQCSSQNFDESCFSSSPEAQGTQPADEDGSNVPAMLRQHTLQQLLPTSFESRFSSSPEAQGTPLASNDGRSDISVPVSSSPSSKINLFQPGTKILSTKADLAVPEGLQGDIAPTIWQPSSSFSEPSSALLDKGQSGTAADVSTPLHDPHINKRPLLSARIPETVLASKKRRFTCLSTPKAKPNTQEREIFASLSNSIHPPPPTTSSEKLVTHITPQLQSQFWESPELQGKYKPSPHRELRQSERGYWTFDTTSWSAKVQIKFWVFLQSNIGSGVSGWGIWCLREQDGEAFERIDNDGQRTGNVGQEGHREQSENEGKRAELGTVKVFCWGEVVGHVWLLCYVASQAKLKHVESRWIDADGEIVIRI